MKTEAEIRRQIARRFKKYGSIQAFCTQHGLSHSYVSDVLNGRRPPGAKMQRALGIKRVVAYIPVDNDVV